MMSEEKVSAESIIIIVVPVLLGLLVIAGTFVLGKASLQIQC